MTFVKIAPFNLEKILIPTSTARSVGFIFAKKNLRKFEKLHMLHSSKIYRHIWITYRGDAVAKEMEQRYFVSVDTNIVFVYVFSFVLGFVFSSIRNLAFVDKKIDKRIEKEIKTASSGSEGSSVFHDIGEKRFELRFPGAVAHVKKILLI